jgi:hypothetical protein
LRRINDKTLSRTTQYEYDAASNRRRVFSLYHDGVGGDEKTQDYWYAYDNMNRFTVTMGSLVDAQGAVLNVASNPSARGAGSIVRGAAGTALGYDAASQRVRAVGPAGAQDYGYDAGGFLADVLVNGALRTRRINDVIGRLATYQEFAADGVTLTQTTVNTYSPPTASRSRRRRSTRTTATTTCCRPIAAAAEPVTTTATQQPASCAANCSPRSAH